MFLSPNVLATDNIWQFDPALEKIYNLILNLQTDQAYTELSHLKNANELHKMYVQTFLETVDILITEDEKRFEKVHEEIHRRIERLDQMPASAETLFLKAELNLQRGFNLLNLSQELNAVLAIRQAYQATQECIKKYPSFIPIKKTYGVLQVMVGSVPGKYQWFMSLLGMKGSVKVGQKNLEELRLSKSSLSTEATVLYFTIKGFINQQFPEAAAGFLEILQKEPDNRLFLFLAINMLMKDSQGEEALTLIQNLEKQPSGLAMAYIDYLHGEALLEKGDYAQAIPYYQKFIKSYKSQSFKKDSYFKISLCYYLLGDKENAKKNFEIARTTGRATADPDKYAAAMLAEGSFPNAKILKLRFHTDGGYYKEAKEVLKTIYPSDLKETKDMTEYLYRKGRLAHKTHDLTGAKQFYEQTIDLAGSEPWYFAPNASLQLGYIYQSQGDAVNAKKYFEKALSYRKYEYKSGIDSKAKAALEELKD